jgi:hypothetical protein
MTNVDTFVEGVPMTQAVGDGSFRFDPGGPGHDFTIESDPGLDARSPTSAGLRNRLQDCTFHWVDPTTIKSRQWIMYPDYVGGHISILAAKGGTGKSSLAVVEALSIATGRNLLHPTDFRRQPKKVRVLYVNLEDDDDEMKRRVIAAMKQYGLSDKDIDDRLMVAAGRDIPLVMGRPPKNPEDSRIDPSVQGELIQLLKDKSISVLIVDPFIFTHRLLENDNAMQAELMNAWGFVASEAGAAIMIVHHARKLNGEEATDDAIRGASSVLAAARSARVINPMTDDEAATLNIAEEDRRNYFRISNAKHNLARPAATAEWCKLVEVSLDNEPATGDHDRIGVVTSFAPPDPATGVTAEHARLVQNYLVNNGPQRRARNSPDWFGWKVAELLGHGAWPQGSHRSGPDGKRAAARAVTVLNVLLERGVVQLGEEMVGRKSRPIWRVGGLQFEGDDRTAHGTLPF